MKDEMAKSPYDDLYEAYQEELSREDYMPERKEVRREPVDKADVHFKFKTLKAESE